MAIALAALLALGPWVVYEIALSNIVGRPTYPTLQKLTSNEEQVTWQSLKEQGPIKIEKLTPHAYILHFLDFSKPSPGASVAWFVARNHNSGHLKNRRMTWWHLSGAALTIWLTRNWDASQLLAKVAEIRFDRPQSPTSMSR